jgi:DNA-directed RNA polymerase subunit beta'
MLRTTIGQLMINETLPTNLRDYNRKLDKKGLSTLLQEVAQKHPEQYRQIAKELSDVGRDIAYSTGGNSFGLKHMRKSVIAKRTYAKLRQDIARVHANPRLTDKQKDEKVLILVGDANEPLVDKIYQESLKDGNPLAYQVLSGSRGNTTNLRGLLAGDGLYVDGQDRPIPIPVLSSTSAGLSPVEYWAGSYGSRKGITDVKLATADAGYMAKQMNRATHRLLVSSMDDDKETGAARLGMPVDTDDMDSEGSLLALAVGGYKRNTVLTPKILKDLKKGGHKRILIRSPIVGGPADGGVYSRDVGERERGGLSPIGDYVGMTAAQALSEPLTQAQISSKHSGGVAGAAAGVSGFALINQLVNVPKTFRNGAAHAQADGKVQKIEAAPQGGNYITIQGEQHYAGPGLDIKVKAGDIVEAGDILSAGIPNPAEIVQHKGIGAGRKYLVKSVRDAYADARVYAHRRNIELVSRGLIDHVRIDEEIGNYVPGDVIPYSALANQYKARTGSRLVDYRQAKGKYLERPVLHYTIGTKIRPSMLKDFEQFGVQKLEVHDEPPPFQPEMRPAEKGLEHDPDWATRMMGAGQKRGPGSLLAGMHRGDVSDEAGTSFVPSLMSAENFGRTGVTKGWK